jgi:hypothetical protein
VSGLDTLEGLTITATDAPTAPRAGVAEPSLGLVIQGGKRTVSGDQVFDYAAGEFLIAQLDLPVVGQVTAASAACPFLGIGVRIDPAEIAALLLEAPVTAGRPPARTPGIAVARAGTPLLEALAHLAGLFDTPQDMPVLAPLYRREVLWRLLTGPQGAVVRQIGLAPIQYQKAVRLQEARLALVSGGRDVAEVAHAVGYDSASQFSREYRRLFGAPPGRDAQRIRTADGVPVP